ncbi:hypothetical protein P4S67_04400 [Pseudoalteromonas sp. B137]
MDSHTIKKQRMELLFSQSIKDVACFGFQPHFEEHLEFLKREEERLKRTERKLKPICNNEELELVNQCKESNVVWLNPKS